MNRTLVTCLLALAGIALGVTLERAGVFGTASAPPSSPPAGGESALEHAQRHLDPTYRCPMHPEVLSETPGRCPICGMALVETQPAPGAPAGALGLVELEPAIVQRLGVRTVPAEEGVLERSSRTVGYVELPENAARPVNAGLGGRLQRFGVEGPGARVNPGDLLFELFVAEALAPQRALASARDPAEREAARAALRALGVRSASLARIEAEGLVDGLVPVLAETPGEVLSLSATPGSTLGPGDPVLELADPALRAVRTEVFARDAVWMQVGLPAELSLPELPGRRWQGQVSRIMPRVDPVSRALRLRLAVEDPDGVLRPDMLADVVIRQALPQAMVHVPREAVIRDADSARVVVALGEGRFALREVGVAGEYGERMALSHGLQPGERVVASGQFLIDAEASLRASLERLDSSRAEAAPAPAPALDRGGSDAPAGASPAEPAPASGDTQDHGPDDAPTEPPPAGPAPASDATPGPDAHGQDGAAAPAAAPPAGSVPASPDAADHGAPAPQHAPEAGEQGGYGAAH